MGVLVLMGFGPLHVRAQGGRDDVTAQHHLPAPNNALVRIVRVGTPQLIGQLLHLFGSPNRYGLPAFYALHVWAWKENPKGTFVNWHPNVSCDGFNGKNP